MKSDLLKYMVPHKSMHISVYGSTHQNLKSPINFGKEMNRITFLSISMSKKSLGEYMFCSPVDETIFRVAPTHSSKLNTSDSKSLWAHFIMRFPATEPAFLTLFWATLVKCSPSLSKSKTGSHYQKYVQNFKFSYLAQ